jgi:hypothetical protein
MGISLYVIGSEDLLDSLADLRDKEEKSLLEV